METVEQVRQILEANAGNSAIVVSYSGGKDSHRMLGFLREQFPTAKTYVVMADTGFEHVKPVTAIDWARQQVAAFGLELHVVKNPNKTYLEMVERRGKFPAPGLRQCTSDLKRGPIHKFIRNIPEKVVIDATGIRAQESDSRAKQNPWKFDEGQSKAGRKVWNWMPIFRETLADVLNWHFEHNQSFHPVYNVYLMATEAGVTVPEHVPATGYLKRFSCRVCIFATNADLRAIYHHDNEAFNLIANLEQKIGFTMRASGESLFQILGQNVPDVQDRPCAA